jgi:hypothetical protein
MAQPLATGPLPVAVGGGRAGPTGADHSPQSLHANLPQTVASDPGPGQAVRLSTAQATDVKNLRITFWGVQGSCPVFPPVAAVNEYSRHVAVYTLTKALEELGAGAAGGACTVRQRVEELLGGPPTPAAVEALQRKLGLPPLPIYGGETTCVQVDTADDQVLLIDGGSGIRHFAVHITNRWRDRADRTLHFFGSHEHLDHRSGLPFSRFVFVRNNPFKVHVYGTYRFLTALDERFGLFSRTVRDSTHLDDPLDYSMMAASFSGTELRNWEDPKAYDPTVTEPPWEVRDMRQPVEIGRTRVTPFNVYHGRTRVLAYKIERAGAAFVFCTDHELRHGPDAGVGGDDGRQRDSHAAEERLAAHCLDADVGYFDGQYRLSEYLGRTGIGNSPPVSKVDWGHGCIEDVV